MAKKARNLQQGMLERWSVPPKDLKVSLKESYSGSRESHS